MENETSKKDNYALLPASIIISSLFLSGAIIYYSRTTLAPGPSVKNQSTTEEKHASLGYADILPAEGAALPIVWGDLGARLASVGAIDKGRFQDLYVSQGQFTKEYEALLTGTNDSPLKITEENAGYLLNLFWALGLASKNPILDSGEISDPRYGGVERLASTGGWTMAEGSPTDHFSRHIFFTLTPEQQALVDKISKGIYRPCCNNSTYMPDCNHGMAMLGLLELMASQGASEEDMWKAAFTVNSYWFPDAYLTIATYLKGKGIEWKDVSPQEILGATYSSGSGFGKIAAVVEGGRNSSSSCGVSAPQKAVPQRKQSSCGI